MRAFLTAEDGAVTVDWTVMTGGVVGLGLAVAGVVTAGVQDLTQDIHDQLVGQNISSSFRTLIEQACAAGSGPYAGDYNGMSVTSILIYDADDFVGGLPDEVSGGRIDPGASMTLVLADDAVPIRIDIADDDDQLNELDNNQILAQGVMIGDQAFGEGFDVRGAYNMTDSESGQALTTLHFGDPFSGYTIGPVLATAATNPLEPGEEITFDGSTTTHGNELSYSALLSCE